MVRLVVAVAERRSVNRLLVLYCTLLAGFWGGHKFLLGARREGWLYLMLSWSAVPLLAALLDFIDLLSRPVLGQGFLKRRLACNTPEQSDRIGRSTWLRLGLAGLLMALLVVCFSLAEADL